MIIGYRLSGAQLAVLLSFATTTVTGAVTYLRIRPAQYGGFTLPNPGSQFSPGYVYDVGNVLALISNNSVATNLAFRASRRRRLHRGDEWRLGARHLYRDGDIGARIRQSVNRDCSMTSAVSMTSTAYRVRFQRSK